MKVFIDTDIFVRNLRYRDDKDIIDNDRFLDLVKEKKIIGFTSIYNLLELCGILSFNLSAESLLYFYGGFKKRFRLKRILFGAYSDETLIININTVFAQLLKKMSFGDALITGCVGYHGDLLEGFVSWDVKHYGGKLNMDVYSPAELLKRYDVEV